MEPAGTGFMPQQKDLLSLAMREKVAFARIERRPPLGLSVAEDGLPSSFALDLNAFRLQIPLFHFNALAASNFLPVNGVFAHFGPDSVQFLIYLALRRPDLQLIALEPRFESIQQQAGAVAMAGLVDRIKILHCEIGHISEIVPDVTDLFSSTMTFNQLMSPDELSLLLGESARVRIHSGAGLWFFDYSRPKLSRTIDDFVQMAYPKAPGPFRIRERHSLQTAFVVDEVADAAKRLNVGEIQSALSKPLGVYQAHWIEPTGSGIVAGHARWEEEQLTPDAIKEFQALSQMFPHKLLPPHLR